MALRNQAATAGTTDAPSFRTNYSDSIRVCTDVLKTGVEPCASFADWRPAMPRAAHSCSDTQSDGTRRSKNLLQVSSGLKPRQMVRFTRRTNSARTAGGLGSQVRRPGHDCCGRNDRTAQGQENQGQCFDKLSTSGKYRDAVRSTQQVVVKCWGLKWICLTVLIPLPWSKRHWALPFLTLLAPSEQANEKAGKRHPSTSSGHRKTTVDWTIQAVKVTSRWLQYAAWTLVGDGAYACIALAHSCNANNVTLISRLRLDARLFDFPEEQPASKRGPKPKKGKRQPRLSELAADPNQSWQEVDIAWYGGEVKRRKILSGVCLWHTNGQHPVKIRWVLVVDPEGKDKPEAFFTTDENLAPKRIVEIFVLRWNIEVTFEEVRRHLGVETQRQWSDLAIARTTPALMGLFSLVCLIALQIVKDGSLPLRHAAWYRKQDAAFSDVLAFVRRAIWAGKYLHNSVPGADRLELSRDEMDTLLDRLAATA